MRQAERRERLKRERLVEERYGQSLRQALLPLESESMLPEASYETSRSDPVGLLQRISATQSDRTQYVLVVTDMADTRWKTLPKIPMPPSKIVEPGSEIAADRGHRRTPGRRPSSESIRLSLVQ